MWPQALGLSWGNPECGGLQGHLGCPLLQELLLFLKILLMWGLRPNLGTSDSELSSVKWAGSLAQWVCDRLGLSIRRVREWGPAEEGQGP